MCKLSNLQMIMILSLPYDDVVDGHHERLTAAVLLHAPPPGLRALVLMNSIPIKPDV